MDSKLRIKKLTPNAILPRKGSKDASGYDLFACVDSGSLTIGKDPQLVRTGISIEFPNSFDAQIRPRSGLSSKGIGVTLGTIDSDYRGELMITMYVFGTRESFIINHGDRIAQLVITKLADLEMEEVEELSATDRGIGGHGSTGMR